MYLTNLLYAGRGVVVEEGAPLRVQRLEGGLVFRRQLEIENRAVRPSCLRQDLFAGEPLVFLDGCVFPRLEFRQ